MLDVLQSLHKSISAKQKPHGVTRGAFSISLARLLTKQRIRFYLLLKTM
jgi:hypothetical protein